MRFFLSLLTDGALAGAVYALRRLVGQPMIALVMVTLGLGALMRGAAPIVFRGVPPGVPLPIPADPLAVHGVLVAPDRLVAATIAIVGIVGVGWFFHRTRTGLALRAIADDQQVAMAVGVDVHRHFAIAWGLVGALAVVAGTLWTFVAGGGFSSVASYLVLVLMLFVRPHGLFGRRDVERV